jgi:hypothetical protein
MEMLAGSLPSLKVHFSRCESCVLDGVQPLWPIRPTTSLWWEAAQRA